MRSSLSCRTATSGACDDARERARGAHVGAPRLGSLANALRRIMIAEVPTLGAPRRIYVTRRCSHLAFVAIDLIEVERNTSVLFDQFLTHRLGLVPLRSDRVDEFSYTWVSTDAAECFLCSPFFLNGANALEDRTATARHQTFAVDAPLCSRSMSRARATRRFQSQVPI